MADEGGDGGPYPMPAANPPTGPSADIELPASSSPAVEGGAADLQPNPTVLDRRGNDVAATQRESDWSVVMLRGLSEEKIALMKSHVSSLIEKGKAIEENFEEIAKDLYDEDEEVIRKEFGSPARVEKVLKIAPQEDAVSLFNALTDEPNVGFRSLIDLVGILENLEHPEWEAIARTLPIFVDRGREPIPDDNISMSSFYNTNAGIVDKDHQTDLTTDFFETKITHAKSLFVGMSISDTFEKFRASGVPFVSGVSGVMQQICVIMEADKQKDLLTHIEMEERERIIVMHVAGLVTGGNHSLMECLLPAMAYGYFQTVPNPLESPGGYKMAIAAFEQHLQVLGFYGGSTLSA
jgi:hypothetical protein